MAMDRETFEKVFGKKLDTMEGQKWYELMGWRHDVGFERVSDRARTVRCIICGRRGAGMRGSWRELQGALLIVNRWQRACMKPHTEECACGKHYPTKHALAMHVQACRRHRIPGHGRMDQVGY